MGTGFVSSLRIRFLSLSLFNRVLIGNSIVIVIGAIGGTLLTRYLTLVGNLGLILFFSTLGILLTLLVNYAIIRSALRPLEKVRKMVEQIETRNPRIPGAVMRETDADTKRLVAAINAMIGRLERHTRQMRALSERAINAQEEERKRIARGLHDDTAQALAMLIINLERLEDTLPEDSRAITSRLSAARRLASQILEDLRKIIYDLRPTLLDDLGLVPAIRWCSQSSLEAAGIQVQFNTPDETLRLPPHLETTLFRVTQEVMSNVLRHAHAKNVFVRLELKDERVSLEVEDDGQGFDLEQAQDKAITGKRLGLLGIRERLALVNGEVQVQSRPGRGTRLQVWVPLSLEDTVNA